MRPKALRTFERFYLCSIAASAISFLISPPIANEKLSAFAIYTILLIILSLFVLLCLMVARIGSRIAKWILVGNFILTVLQLFRTQQPALPDYAMAFPIASIALQGIAIWFLFKPEARNWKSEKSHKTLSIVGNAIIDLGLLAFLGGQIWIGLTSTPEAFYFWVPFLVIVLFFRFRQTKARWVKA